MFCSTRFLKTLYLMLLMSSGLMAGSDSMEKIPVEVAERFASLALSCVHQEYPNKIAHTMNKDEDAQPPRKLHPSFYGCFDWHSSVHGHWLLVRILRLFPDAPFAPKIEAALNQSFTAENMVGEVAYFEAEGRASYERPYGLAWLLQLTAELREWDDARAKKWLTLLEPLETVVAARFESWLPKLAYPIRTGEHSQTAFAFGLVLDWARVSGNKTLEDLLVKNCTAYYLKDRGCNLAFEPSGQDFLSPCLAEADLMRRLLEPTAFSAWLGGFMPDIPLEKDDNWLPIGVVTDPSDGKLAHLDGLNLSRAWMLEGMISGLPKDDPRIPTLEAAVVRHRESGLASVTGEHYEGGHWLGSFAVYLVTRRGIDKK